MVLNINSVVKMAIGPLCPITTGGPQPSQEFLSFVYGSVCLCACLCLSVCVYMSLCVSVYIYMSVCLSSEYEYVSVYLTIKEPAASYTYQFSSAVGKEDKLLTQTSRV